MLQLLVCSDVHTYINNIMLAAGKLGHVDAILIAGDIEEEKDRLLEALDGTPVLTICGNCDYYLNSDYPQELLIDISEHTFSSGSTVPAADVPAASVQAASVTAADVSNTRLCIDQTPHIEHVRELSYGTVPERLASLPPYIQKYMPKGLLSRMACDKRDPRIMHRILMTHGKEYEVPDLSLLAARAALWDADIIIFGHTHKYLQEKRQGGKYLFLNPGCLVGDPKAQIRSWGQYEICSFVSLTISPGGEVNAEHFYI